MRKIAKGDKDMTLKLGSLFDGSGGFPLAGEMCGIEPVWAAEVEPYPIAVTTSRFPHMKHLGDVSKIHGGDDIPVSSSRYYLWYDFDSNKWDYMEECINSITQGLVYFAPFDVAQSAIRDVVEPFCEKHPEYLEWLRGDKR